MLHNDPRRRGAPGQVRAARGGGRGRRRHLLRAAAPVHGPRQPARPAALPHMGQPGPGGRAAGARRARASCSLAVVPCSRDLNLRGPSCSTQQKTGVRRVPRLACSCLQRARHCPPLAAQEGDTWRRASVPQLCMSAGATPAHGVSCCYTAGHGRVLCASDLNGCTRPGDRSSNPLHRAAPQHCSVHPAHEPARARARRPPGGNGAAPAGAGADAAPARPPPGDGELADALRRVRLGALLQRDGSGAAAGGRGGGGGGAPAGLDAVADWASMLSLGEQQRLAFARCGGRTRVCASSVRGEGQRVACDQCGAGQDRCRAMLQTQDRQKRTGVLPGPQRCRARPARQRGARASVAVASEHALTVEAAGARGALSA